MTTLKFNSKNGKNVNRKLPLIQDAEFFVLASQATVDRFQYFLLLGCHLLGDKAIKVDVAVAQLIA